MLMTLFTYTVDLREDGSYISVVRGADGATKEFYLAACKTPESVVGIRKFMDSMTDELTEGYFPKPRKEKVKKEKS